MSKPEIDYGFNNGSLDYSVTAFGWGGGVVEEREGERPIIATPDKQTLERLKKELFGSAHTIEGPDESGAIQVGMMNIDAPAYNGLRVYNMGIGGNAQHPVGLLEVQHMAAAHPEQAFLVANNAGSGGSSLVPRDIMREMKSSGSYRPQGEWMVDNMRHIFERYYNRLTIEGNSAGARIGLGMSAALLTEIDEFEIIGLQVMDPPGASNKTTPGVLASFVRQAPRAKAYSKSPYNPKENGTLEEPTTANLFTASGAFVDNMWNHPSVMRSRQGFEKDLYEAAASVAGGGNLVVIQPEHSEFAAPEQMRQALGRAASTLPAYNAPIHVVIKGHSHAMMSENVGPNPLVTAYEIARFEAGRAA